MKEKNSALEIVWIAGALLISMGLVFALTGKSVFVERSLEIQSCNRNLSIDTKLAFFTVFNLLLLFVYFIKEGLQKFSRPLKNIILSLIVIGNIISLSLFIKLLSLLEAVDIKTGESNKMATLIITFIVALQFILLIGLLLLGIKTGTLTKKRATPTPGWRG